MWRFMVMTERQTHAYMYARQGKKDNDSRLLEIATRTDSLIFGLKNKFLFWNP